MGFRILRGYSTEGRKHIHAALALPKVQESDVVHAHALYVGADLAITQGDHAEASRMLEACLALRRGIGNPFDIAATLSTLSPVRIHAGDARAAREGEEEALGIFRQLGDRSAEAIALLHLGEICVHIGEYENARQYLEQSLTIAPSRRVQGNRERRRTDAGPGRAGARQPAGRASALRTLAGSLRGRGGQARRRDGVVVDGQGRYRGGRPGIRAQQAGRRRCGHSNRSR